MIIATYLLGALVTANLILGAEKRYSIKLIVVTAILLLGVFASAKPKLVKFEDVNWGRVCSQYKFNQLDNREIRFFQDVIDRDYSSGGYEIQFEELCESELSI